MRDVPERIQYNGWFKLQTGDKKWEKRSSVSNPMTLEISKYGVEWRWGVSAYTLFNWLLGSIVEKWQSIQEIKYGISHLKVEETQACLLLGR